MLHPEQCHEPPLGLGLLQYPNTQCVSKLLHTSIGLAWEHTSAENGNHLPHLSGDGLGLDQLVGEGLGLLGLDQVGEGLGLLGLYQLMGDGLGLL